MTNLNRRIAAVANGQLGIVSRSQVHSVGGSDDQLRRRVQSGALLPIGRQTFRLPGADVTAVADLRALLLDIGGQAWASGPTAAALLGFDGFRLAAPFDVTVLRGRNIQRVGHRIHTTTALELIDRTQVDGIPVFSGARTLVDLARSATIDELVVALDSGLRDGRFNEDLLHRRICALACKGRYGIPRLLNAIRTFEHGRGGHSWLERRFLELVEGAGLPRPLTQQVLTRAQDRLVRVDFRFSGTNVVVEVLGYRYHRTPTQIERDAQRMNALVADGYRPYQFAYATVVNDAGVMLADLRQALRQAA
jgi:hypothetical protein